MSVVPQQFSVVARGAGGTRSAAAGTSLREPLQDQQIRAFAPVLQGRLIKYIRRCI
jgi:hypothetical protein